MFNKRKRKNKVFKTVLTVLEIYKQSSLLKGKSDTKVSLFFEQWNSKEVNSKVLTTS